MTPPVRRPSSSRDATRISVRIVARASRETVVGMRAGFLLVRVTAAPVDGAANAALIRVVAKHLRVGHSAVRLVSGHGSKVKVLEVEGLDEAEVARRLGAEIDATADAEASAESAT